MDLRLVKLKLKEIGKEILKVIRKEKQMG